MNKLAKQLKQIQRLRDIHLECYLAFRNFEEMAKFRAPNAVGQKKAAENAKSIGNYRSFFNSAVRSMNYSFLMHLSRLYIGADSLTLRRLLNTIEQNPTTVEDYRELHKDQSELLQAIHEYVGMQPGDFVAARKYLQDVQPIVDKLRHNRNNYLVHLDVNQTALMDTTYQELFELIETADKILKLLNRRLDMRGETYQVVESELQLQTKALMRLLRQGTII